MRIKSNDIYWLQIKEKKTEYHETVFKEAGVVLSISGSTHTMENKHCLSLFTNNLNVYAPENVVQILKQNMARTKPELHRCTTGTPSD